MHFFGKIPAIAFLTAILVLETKGLPVYQNDELPSYSHIEPDTTLIFKRKDAVLPKTNIDDKDYYKILTIEPKQIQNNQHEMKFQPILVQLPVNLLSKTIDNNNVKNDFDIKAESAKNNVQIPSGKTDDLALLVNGRVVSINKNEDLQLKSELKTHPEDDSSEEILEPASARYYYRPLFRIRHLTRRYRRFYDNDWKNAGYLRPGKAVGYMNSYDDFPTVA